MIDPSQYSRVHEMERLNATDALIAWDNETNSIGHITGQKVLDCPITEVTGTTYTILSTDRVIRTTSGSSVTITLPNNLPAGRGIAVSQDGAGQVTFSPASGATLHNLDSETKTAGQYAIVGLFVKTNTTGTNAVYSLSGQVGA